MLNDDAIFGPLPKGDKVASPSPQMLNDFLERTTKDLAAESHVADFIRYRKALAHVENYELRMQAIETRPNAVEQALFGALLHTRFFNRSLMLALGESKYHLWELASIDLAGPSRFIESAELTMKNLRKRKAQDMLHMSRLKNMAEERKTMLRRREARWADLAAELMDIALYVLENLVKVERLCERAIAMLKPEFAARKERQLVDSIKTMLKQQLTDALRYRHVTTEDVHRAKQEVDLLAGELRAGTEEDRGRMLSVYESVRGHVHHCAGELHELLEEFRGKEIGAGQEHVLQFKRIEQSLVSLMAGYPALLDLTGARPGAARRLLIENKRQEMVAWLLEEVRKGPRGRIDRRTKSDRRKRKDPNYKGPERRSGKERRK